MRHPAFLAAVVTAAFVLAAPAGARAADEDVECANPWVVVVRKGGDVVEGRMVKDIDTGVVVDVGGRSVFVPETDIQEVVEDCARAGMAPAPRVQTGPANAPRVPQAAPAPAPRARGEARFRNALIDQVQRAMRWGGGICVSFGCGLCSTGIVIALLGGLQQLNSGSSALSPDPIVNVLLFVGLVGTVMGGLSVVFFGSGAGMIFAAQAADFLRPEPEAPAGSEQDLPPTTRRGPFFMN